MHYWKYLVILLSPWLVACDTQPDAQEIIDRAIAAHGGEHLDQAQLRFKFRKKDYQVHLNDGVFRYQSEYQDSLGSIHDELSNQGFIRKINNRTAKLSEEDSIVHMDALNSVVYFALLPYFLNDPSANKKLLEETTIQGEPYYKIQVTFDQEGGGTDHEDVFVYWIHQDRYTMDYLAYEFHVNGGGTRFREAYNVREVNGIRLADYNNYESTVENFQLSEYDRLFEEKQVKKLSEIKLENVTVEPLVD